MTQKELNELETAVDGEPAASETPINIRLGDDLLAAVDAYAEKKSWSRAETIRALLARALHTVPSQQCSKCRGWYTSPHQCRGTYPA